MKRVLALLSAFVLTLAAYSQSTDWEVYATVDGVTIYTKEAECITARVPDQFAILIKVENSNSYSVNVEYDQVIWYNGALATEDIGNEENHHLVAIKNNSSEEGSCEVPHGAFYIYKDFIVFDAKKKLTKFELQNIKVTRQ